MEHKFYINSRNGYAAMLEQYRAMHEQIGKARFFCLTTIRVRALFMI